ncbi:MAG: endonuclease/exonuclease/phosphatase family protein [Actinomycetota bacterium]|nr:endonuclease/exonuclease/phosphatase family protein [Actinomycetota bacterium]
MTTIGDRSGLRLLTANLLNGSADAPAFAELVQREGADVVAVQELAPPAAEALQAVLPFGRLEAAWDFRGMGIALRRPGKVRRVGLARRDAWAADLYPPDWPEIGRHVEVLNVHILAPILWPPWRTFRIRHAQVRALETHLEESICPARVVLGDLNATPAWGAYRRLAARMDDAGVLAALRTGRRPTPTWGPRPEGRRLLRIDHAFVSGVEVRDARTLRVAGSDHDALLIDVS